MSKAKSPTQSHVPIAWPEGRATVPPGFDDFPDGNISAGYAPFIVSKVNPRSKPTPARGRSSPKPTARKPKRTRRTSPTAA